MAGKPAARVGDPTAHGGTILPPGEPMVLIGGMPAAFMGSMHVCPAVNPGVPPPPHVGMNIIATGVTVLIGGKPAARMGDTAICAGPPATIVSGCPTVLIGDGGGGGGGGAGSGQKGDKKDDTDSKEDKEDHYLDVKFTDKAGKPVVGVAYKAKDPESKESQGAIYGKVRKTGLQEGNCEIELRAITKAVWSEKEARVGDKVKLQVEVSGFDSGVKAEFNIFEKDISSADDLIANLEGEVSGGKAEVEWEYQYVEDDDDVSNPQEKASGYSLPEYYFIVRVENAQLRSPMLQYKDYVEVTLKDAEGNAIGEAPFRLFFENGEVRDGQLDGNGYRKVENVPPGRWSVDFPGGGHVTQAEG